MSTIAATNLKNASSGSNNIVLNTDGTTTIAAPSNIIKSGTAVASTSGTSIDFTGIPSWVKRVTVMFSGVSMSGTSPLMLQLGDSGGIETTGYVSSVSTGSTVDTSTAGLLIVRSHTAASTLHGIAGICQVDPAANTWAHSGSFGYSIANYTSASGGSKSLSSNLDRIRITTVNGTDAFDAGTINILYEG